MDYPYWRRQQPGKALFPDIEWNIPEQRSQRGRLAIIGGNKLGFAAVAESFDVACQTGIGDARVLLPDALRSSIPKAITDTVYAPTNPSGSLSKDAAADMHAVSTWANAVLMTGDAGRSSETAILYENFIQDFDGQLTITRDAVDLVKNSSTLLLDRPNTLLVVSFAQLQKLFQAVYFPKILTFSMQLTNLVETLHKFTITYPVTIVVLHKDHLIVTYGGEVITQEWGNPMAIWRGSVAAKAASYWLWNPGKPLEAVATSIA